MQAIISHGAMELQLPLSQLLPARLPPRREHGKLTSNGFILADSPRIVAGARLDEAFCLDLARHPMRLQAALAQTRTGWWVRNGHAALKPAALYRSPAFGEVFFLPDLLLLQYCTLRVGIGRMLHLAIEVCAPACFYARGVPITQLCGVLCGRYLVSVLTSGGLCALCHRVICWIIAAHTRGRHMASHRLRHTAHRIWYP